MEPSCSLACYLDVFVVSSFESFVNNFRSSKGILVYKVEKSKVLMTMTMTMTMKYSLLPSDIQFIISNLTKEIIHITCVKSINLAKGA